MAKSGLSLRRVDDNVTVARTGRMAWFVLAPQRWDFRSRAERDDMLHAAAVGYASLTGRVHLRVTSRPYPVDEWARAVAAEFPTPLPGWGQHLRAEQRHLLGLTLAEKVVYLGVELHAGKGRRSAQAEERRTIDGIVAGPGLDGRPATPGEVEYLLHRSASLGAPAPFTLPPEAAAWEPDDVAAFTDRAKWTSEPYARTVRVVADVNGQQHERHIAVLTLGRMGELDIPGSMGPWLQRSDRLTFPVEWSVMADVLPPDKVKRWAHAVLDRVTAQERHHVDDHGLEAPLALSRQKVRALQVEDEVTRDDPLFTRMDCWVRAAVAGSSEEEALERAERLVKLYAPQLPLSRAAGQFHAAREFIPGEARSSSAHRRRMPVTTFAGAAPQVTALVGDRAGFLLGDTAGTSQRAAFWHPWKAMEVRERSGATLVSGGLGSGKSTLGGVVLYQAALAGVRSVALDPAGPLAELCRIPELRARSRAVDLMNAEPGALSPFTVIGDPRREDAASGQEHARAVTATEAARVALCVDTLTQLLPQSINRESATVMALTDAAGKIRGTATATPWDIIDRLEDGDEHARFLARYLTNLAELPQVQLIFPPRGVRDRTGPDLSGLVLQVLTMRGNTLPPPDKPREEWSITETIGLPLMTLGAYLTQRHVYVKSRHERALMVMDEAHSWTRFSMGQTLVRDLTRDTRKWNVRVVLLSQNLTDALVAGVRNFLDGAFVGRTEDEAEQRVALETLGVPRGAGFEKVLGRLSSRERTADGRTGFREMVWADGNGGVEKVRIHVPAAVRGVLDTTADPTRVEPAKTLALAVS